MRNNLSRLLLEPLPLSGLKRLLIVPDESLQYIPFAALLFPGSGAGKELLVKHFEIDVLPSASVLGILRKARASELHLRPPPRFSPIRFLNQMTSECQRVVQALREAMKIAPPPV